MSAVAKPGVSKWGEVKGEGMGGGVPPPAGARGCVPGKLFKLQMHTGEFKRIFQTKINTLTPVFIPVNFGKIFKLQMHADEF
jgi:hypothetical protein